MPIGQGGKRKGAGRPKGSLANHTLEAQTLRQYMIDQVKANKKELVEALIKKGISGDVSALREILDRSLGKVKDSMEISIPKEDPLTQILEDIRRNNKDIVTERLEKQ